MIIEHSVEGKVIRFRFTDNPARFSVDDWHNVVCVMAGMQSWQFRRWRYNNPSVLFSKGGGASAA